MLRQPHAEADPKSEREKAHDNDREEASCASSADPPVVQHRHRPYRPNGLQDDENDGIQTACADVEVKRCELLVLVPCSVFPCRRKGVRGRTVYRRERDDRYL